MVMVVVMVMVMVLMVVICGGEPPAGVPVPVVAHHGCGGATHPGGGGHHCHVDDRYTAL